MTPHGPTAQLFIFVGLFCAACGPTAAEIQQRQWNALSQKLDQIYSDSAIPGPPTAREQEVQARARAAYRSYGFTPDVFLEAKWAYRLAVIERMERNEITRAQANALIAEYVRRVEEVRTQQLLQIYQAMTLNSAVQAAAWSQFSQSMNALSQGMRQYERQQQLTTPIWCTTQYLGNMATTTCH